MKTRRRGVAVVAVMLAAAATQAGAGGGGFAGASEYTQLLNNVQLVEAEMTRVQQYMNQILQYESMLKNLMTDPLGVLAPDVARMAKNAGRLISMGKDIGSTMARVDENFANTFKNATAATFATRFKLWTNASHDSLRVAMLNAGLQREQFMDDVAAVEALTNKVSASRGNMEALQALGALNANQLQESIKLRDLLSQQQLAQNTYLASQTSKEQARQTNVDKLSAPYTKPIPQIEPGTFQLIQWR